MISGSLALSGALLEDAFHDAEGSRGGDLHPLLLRVTFFFLTLHLPSIFRIFFLSFLFPFFFAWLSVSRGDNYAFFYDTCDIVSFFYFKNFSFARSFNLSLHFLLYSILFTHFSIVNITFCYSSILAIMYSLNDNYFFFFFLISLISIIYLGLCCFVLAIL